MREEERELGGGGRDVNNQADPPRCLPAPNTVQNASRAQPLSTHPWWRGYGAPFSQRQRLRHRGGVTPPRLYSRAFSGLQAAHGVRVFCPRCLLSAFCDSDPRCWPGGSQVERRSGLLTAG